MGPNNAYTPPNTRKATTYSIETAAKNLANAKAARLSIPGYELYRNKQHQYIDSSRKLSDIEVIGIRLGYSDIGNVSSFSLNRRPKR